MSKNLIKSSPFLLLVLDNNQSLNRHIFLHAKDNHLKSLAEIFYNVFQLPLTQEKKKKFQKNIKVLRKFIQNKEQQRAIILKNYRLFSDMLYLIRKFVKILLKNE